jgi:monofunctional biosynthetic peptidoglycan transglycosylase
MIRKCAIFLLFLLLLGAALVAYSYLSVPDVASLNRTNPGITALMRQREAESRRGGKKARRFQIWVPYRAISESLKSAVLIGEDDAFFQHQGIDYQQMKQSFIKDWEEKSFVRGGSTITQQLAKNLYLSTSKNPLRKLKEFFIARRLEQKLGKRRIFEIYLNVIEWGYDIYGVQAASLTYFLKPASALNAREAALLAAMIPNPRGMSPLRPSKRFLRRTNMVLARMRQYHHIDESQYEQAVSPESTGVDQEEPEGEGSPPAEASPDASPLPVEQWPENQPSKRP